MGLDLKRDPGPMRKAAGWVGYAAALAAVAAATAAGLLIHAEVHVPNLSLLFVLPVVVAAVAFGLGPALTAAVVGAVACNYFLIEPRFTLSVADPSDVLALTLLLTVGAVVSGVAAQSRQRAIEASEAAGQASAVHELARALVAETTRAGVAARCAEALARIFRAPAAVALDDDGELGVHAWPDATLGEADLEAARWSLAVGLAIRGGAYPAGAATFDFWPVTTAQRQRAVVGVQISGRDEGRPAAPERLVEIVTGYLAVALDREAYARQVLENRVQIAGERLKADLLAAVSHDLKTPLSTILITLQSLRKFDHGHDARTRGELLGAAEAEAGRLSRMVENLLDMNRLEAGALAVRPTAAAPEDLVAAAVERAGPALAGRKVVRKTAAGGRLLVDVALFESALANVLENAAKYSGAGATVEIRAGHDQDTGWVEVLDEGPGFAGKAEALFEKFVRGREGDGRPPGTGLGLSIARGFLEAQGGRVEAVDREDRRGGRVRLVAPLAASA